MVISPSSATFVKSLISKYYAGTSDIAPKEIGHREFGFGDFERKISFRHFSFQTWPRLREYLVGNAPPFVSVSTAYYDRPDGRPMESKGWRGAELVFDLDASDLKLNCASEHGRSWVCSDCLASVKSETIKLVEDFLMPDFGFSEGSISINFSGNRGYHVHVNDPEVFKIDSVARTAIADYIKATGIDMRFFFPAMGTRGARLDGPKPTDSGWGGKLARGVIGALNSGENALVAMGMDPKTARLLYRKRADVIIGITTGNWDKVNVPKKAEFWAGVLSAISVKSADSIDRNVSTDVHHLIRLPDTIHGDTGLLAKSVGGLKGLSAFEPMRDAVVFKGKSMKVEIKKSPALEIDGERFGPYAESVQELPLSAAMYLVLKRVADLHQ